MPKSVISETPRCNKCEICGHLIMDGECPPDGEHPPDTRQNSGCFRCCVCNDCLDGVPFTVDFDNKIYCVNDFHWIFVPKCRSCDEGITPVEGTEETIRVVAMEQDFHAQVRAQRVQLLPQAVADR